MRKWLLLCVLALPFVLGACGGGTGTSVKETTTATGETTTLSTTMPPTSVVSSTTTLAQSNDLDSLAPADVVRTFFTSKDATVRYALMFQSTETLAPPMDGRARAQPIDISNLVITGPLAGVPLTESTRTTWKEQLLFGVTYHLDSTSALGQAPGKKELSVVVARQNSQSPWKILIMNEGPVPKELPASEREKLDKLSLADVVRTYFESFDFDTQVYLSAPSWQEMLVEALRDPSQKGDIADLVIGTPYSTPDQTDWAVLRELRVTYKLLVVRNSAAGNPNAASPGEQIRFVSVGEEKQGGPWKILGVGSGP